MGRQPPPSKPPTKRRRGTRIGETHSSTTPDPSEVIRVQSVNIQEDRPLGRTQQRNTTISTNAAPHSNGIGEGSSNDYTPEGMAGRLVQRSSSGSMLETVQRARPAATGRQPDFGPEPPIVGGEDNSVLHPKTPATKSLHARQEGLVSSDAETEESEDHVLPPESQDGTHCDRRLIHEAFPLRGGSVDREGIENIRHLARTSRIPDSILPGFSNSQDISTVGFGQHVPFMNTPQLTTEPMEAVDLETTLSNQEHRSTWDSLSEEETEPPYGRHHLFRNRTGERDIGLGLLDHTITCPTVDEGRKLLQSTNISSSSDSPADSPVRLPSDTEDRRSRFPSTIDTTLSSEDNDEPPSHPPVRVTIPGSSLPVGDQTHTGVPTRTGDLPQIQDPQNPSSNVRPSSSSPNGNPSNAPPHRRGGRRAARDSGRGRASVRQCNGTAERRPTPLKDSTPNVQPVPAVQTRPDDGQATTGTPSIPVGSGSTMIGPDPAITTMPRRTRQALSPARLARVRNLDKVRKRLQRATRKRAAQLAATGGTGDVSLVNKEILDLCAGEPQGESHKDLVGALSKIVPTELPCYREIKSVTRLKIEAICKRLAEVFSNAQDVLPTWTRKTVGRLLKSRRTRTRRKVKRLMAARASVRRGQPSPPVPPGVFLVEVDHFEQELLTEEFQTLSKRMSDRSNNMIKAKGCGNKAGAGGYERAKAHISKREGRPATLRELRKWKVATERQYDAGPSRTAATRRLAGVTIPCADEEVQTTDVEGSSASSGSSSSSDPYDSDGTNSSDGALEPGGSAAFAGLANCNDDTDSDSSADLGIAGVVGEGGRGGPARSGLDVMPAHWHHPIRGVGAFFDRFVELHGVEPGDREVAAWEASGRPWLQRDT